MKMREISFRDCPPCVCNCYDIGPSDQRVVKAETRKWTRRGKVMGDEFSVTYVVGISGDLARDVWRADAWGRWGVVKTVYLKG